MLTKLYQVVEISTDENLKPWRTCRTEKECHDFLESDDFSDLLGTITLTIIPIWTNKSEAEIKRLLRE